MDQAGKEVRARAVSASIVGYMVAIMNITVAPKIVEYWDLVPAIVGGVIGALAGGIPAWLLAKRQSDEMLRRDREQRIENQKALAFSVSVKLMHISNCTVSLYGHVKSRLALLNHPDCAHMEPWEVLLPMIVHTDEGSNRFTAEELGVFVAANEVDFVNKIILLAMRHSTSLAIFKKYCDLRNDFLAIMPHPADYDGPIGLGWLQSGEVNRFKPYTIPMNDLVKGLDDGLDEDVRFARTVVEKFEQVTAQYFKVDKFASLTFPTDDELATRRQPPNLAQ